MHLAFESGTRIIGEVNVEAIDDVIPVWCVPVRFDGRVVAVMVRLQGPLRGPASLYEQAYLSIFERLCVMVADSTFPFREEGVAGPGLPRVGDGIILIDGDGRVEFATPNAANALHRMGIYAPAEGQTLAELGLRVRVVERSLEYAIPAMEEVDRGHDVAILFHCVPLLEHNLVTGVVTLLRDVSDLRQLNRLVLNKEAAVREVHHRVKNNLQTISSLLATPGPTQRRNRDPHRARRGGAPRALDRRRARGPESRTRGRGRLRRDRAFAGAARRRHGPRPAPGRDRGERRLSASCRRTSRRRWPWRSPSC